MQESYGHINKIPFTLKATSYSTSKEKNIQLIIQFKKNEDDSIICEGNVNLNNKENNLTISKKIKLSGEENVEMNVKFTINTIGAVSLVYSFIFLSIFFEQL